jgi:hypothetical protein
VTFDGQGPADLRPGTFFYDRAAKVLYVWLVDFGDPAGRLVEASARDGAVGLNSHVRFAGFDVLHCQMVPGHCAVGAAEGENIVVDSVRALWNDFAGMIIQGTNCVIRNCEMAFNGNVGFTTSVGFGMLMDGNVTHDNNRRGYAPGWMDGGMKLCSWDDSRILRHRAYNEPGAAVWFDGTCMNCVLADSVIETSGVGVYFEISRWGVLVNNIVRNCDRGIWSYSSDVLIAHNIVDRCAEGITVTGDPRGAEYSRGWPEDRWSRWCLAAVRNNLILNNIIIDSVGSYIAIGKPSPHNGPNACDNNVFVWTLPFGHSIGNHIKFMAGWDDYYGRLPFWQAAGYDRHSRIADAALWRTYQDRPSMFDLPHALVLPDAGFRNGAAGDYRLRPDSPLRGLGRQVPAALQSVYVPGRHAWEKTLLEDAPDPKAVPTNAIIEVWGTKHYRVQPEPVPLMMFAPDAQPPCDPGPVEEWTRTGQYPHFAVGAPQPETSK